jgi:glycosyltransferase involved in cell wall biosynthesis
MKALLAKGNEIILIGSDDEYASRLEAEGYSQKSVPFNQASINPIKEFKTVFKLRKILRSENVEVILSWTPKGNIYAAMAAVGLQCPLIVNVSGLGRAFIHINWVTLVVQRLLRYSLGRAKIVFFQNADDQKQFIDQRLVGKERCRLLPGSGVDIKHFRSEKPILATGDRINVLMISRLLWSKGVSEYVHAARILKEKDSSWDFNLLGAFDDSDKSGVSIPQLESWVSEGVINYIGTTDDVRDAIELADCVVLPSYREGLPRAMLEAAAMSRPILTTDVPGCRDCVDEGMNGFLFKPKDVMDLVRALNNFKALEHGARVEMGLAGRRKVITEFDERIVIDSYMQAIAELRNDSCDYRS